MPRFIPYQKCSKRKQRELDRQQRGAWGTVNPVTRHPERSDAYNRKQENRRWQAEARKTPPADGGFALAG